MKNQMVAGPVRYLGDFGASICNILVGVHFIQATRACWPLLHSRSIYYLHRGATFRVQGIETRCRSDDVLCTAEPYRTLVRLWQHHDIIELGASRDHATLTIKQGLLVCCQLVVLFPCMDWGIYSSRYNLFTKLASYDIFLLARSSYWPRYGSGSGKLSRIGFREGRSWPRHSW
jgi:hypothetical protein